jgi:hypothetical protein
LWKKACKGGAAAAPSKSDFGFDCAEWDGVSAAARDFVVKCIEVGRGELPGTVRLYKVDFFYAFSRDHIHTWLEKKQTAPDGLN